MNLARIRQIAERVGAYLLALMFFAVGALGLAGGIINADLYLILMGACFAFCSGGFIYAMATAGPRRRRQVRRAVERYRAGQCVHCGKPNANLLSEPCRHCGSLFSILDWAVIADAIKEESSPSSADSQSA